MALTQFKTAYQNSYETTFFKRFVAKEVMNTRFEKDLKYGSSVVRFAYDITNVRVRSVTRGAASTIDSVTDSSGTLTVNLEKEAVFHVSDGEMTQAGPLNPANKIGSDVGKKVQQDLDARSFAEVRNALFAFDNGDLTTSTSSGTPITLSPTTVPQMVSRMRAKLRVKNNVEGEDMVTVIDSYSGSDINQYLMGKNIDLAGSVFANGYSGEMDMAQVYISENLTSEVVGTAAANFANGEQVVLGGVTFTAVTTIGATPGNFLIGASANASLVNLAGLINNPGTTSANQIALASGDQVTLTDTLKLVATVNASVITVVGIGAGRALSYSETGAQFSLVAWINGYFGNRGAIDLVVQDMKLVDMRETADRRGTNIFNSYLAGIKTFADGAKQFLDVKIAY